jgi:single-strand DNA-binding protein
VNKAMFVGNLTRDPELRQTGSGTSVCELSVAVNDRKPDGNGGYEDYPHYLDVVVWGKQGENCAQWLSKGKKVAITAKIEHQRWEKDGQKHSRVKFVAEPFGVDFLTPRSDSDGGSSNQFIPAGQSAGADFAGADDDIPF